MSSIPAPVMDDLLTLVLAGEASDETKRLVETYAREHPEFAARMTAARTLELAPAPAEPDPALTTLKSVRQFLRLRTIFCGVGLAFTLVPLAFEIDRTGGRFLFLGRQDGIVVGFWSVAVAAWVACWVMNRAVRRTGL